MLGKTFQTAGHSSRLERTHKLWREKRIVSFEAQGRAGSFVLTSGNPEDPASVYTALVLSRIPAPMMIPFPMGDGYRMRSLYSEALPLPRDSRRTVLDRQDPSAMVYSHDVMRATA